MLNTLVVDSSSLISLSESCLFDVLGELSKLGVQFVVPKAVMEESVYHPLKIKRFELNALRINRGVKKKWLHVAELNKHDRSILQRIMENANTCFFSKMGPVKIIHEGEAETLAIINRLGAKGLVIDERTTRMLIEEPLALRELLQKRRKEKIGMKAGQAKFFRNEFKGLVIVRSAELVALAYEKGILQKILGDAQFALEGALYSLKYSGCALSTEEIDKFLHGKGVE